MAQPAKHDPRWARAKLRCRLNVEDIRMAKELGLSPKALLKNIPSASQKWKLPVKYWIRELHEKRFGRRERQAPQPLPVRAEPEPREDDPEIPF